MALVEELITAGLNRADVLRLAAAFPDECRRQLAFLAFAEGIENPGGWLRRAIEGAFAPPPAFLEAEKARARDEERQRRAAAARLDKEVRQGEAAARAAILAAEKARLQRDDPEAWTQVVAAAEARLPAPLRSRPGHAGYLPALNTNIESVLEERLAGEVKIAVGKKGDHVATG
jgi:hypothetical protein